MSRYYLLFTIHLSLFTLYQAFECPEQFVGYAAGILCHAEILVHFHGLEIGMVRAIVAAGDRDVLAADSLLISFSCISSFMFLSFFSCSCERYHSMDTLDRLNLLMPRDNLSDKKVEKFARAATILYLCRRFKI